MKLRFLASVFALVCLLACAWPGSGRTGTISTANLAGQVVSPTAGAFVACPVDDGSSVVAIDVSGTWTGTGGLSVWYAPTPFSGSQPGPRTVPSANIVAFADGSTGNVASGATGLYSTWTTGAGTVYVVAPASGWSGSATVTIRTGPGAGATSVTGRVAQTPPSDSTATGTITIQDTGSSTATGQNSQSIITGSPTAASTVTLAVSGQSTVMYQITGTWTGTLQTERSIDGGTTWTPSGAHISGTAYNASTYTANAVATGDPAGCTTVRVRAIAAVTGTANIRLVASVAGDLVHIGSGVRLFDQTSGVFQSLTALGQAKTNGFTTFGSFSTTEASNSLSTSPGALTLFGSGSLGSAQLGIIATNTGTVDCWVGISSGAHTWIVPAGTTVYIPVGSGVSLFGLTASSTTTLYCVQAGY